MERSSNHPIRTARALLVALTVALGAGGAAAGADGSNQIREVKVGQKGGQTQITVKGSKRPTYTAFKLGTPQRLVVDLADSTLKGVPAVLAASTDIVDGVAVSQFTSGGVAVSRVMVGFRKDAGYRVSVSGNDLVITLSGGGSKDAASGGGVDTEAELLRLRAEAAASREAAERAAGEARAAELALAEARAEQAEREGALTEEARAVKAAAEKRVEALKREQERALAQAATERANREAVERRLADLQARLEAAEAARARAEEERVRAEAEAGSVKERILAQAAEEKTARRTAEEALAAQRAAAEAHRRAAESEKAELKGVLERKERESVQAKRALAEAEQTRQRTEQELVEAMARLRKAASEEREATRSQSQVASRTERELKRAERQLSEAREAAGLATGKAEQATAARESLERELARVRAEAGATSREVERQAAERIAAAEQRLQAAEKARLEMERLNAEITSRLAAAAEAASVAERRAAGFERESAGLRARAGAAEGRLAELERDLRSAEHQAEQARAAVVVRERELAAIRGRAGTAEERVASTERTLAGAREKAEEANRRVAGFEREISAARLQLDEQARRIGELEQAAESSARAAAEARTAGERLARVRAEEAQAAEKEARAAKAAARAAEEKAERATAEARAAQQRLAGAKAREVKAAEEKAAQAMTRARAAEDKAAKAVAAARAAEQKAERTLAAARAAEQKAERTLAEAKAAEEKAAQAVAAGRAAEEKAERTLAAGRAAEEKAERTLAAGRAAEEKAERTLAAARAVTESAAPAATDGARKKTQEELRLERLAAMRDEKKEAVKESTPAPVSKPAGPRITDIRFVDEGGVQKVVIRTDGDLEYSRSDDHRGNAVLSIAGASLPRMLERTLDVTDFGGVVDRVNSFSENGAVRIEVEVAGAASSEVARGDGTIEWTFRGQAPKVAKAQGSRDKGPRTKTLNREESAAYEYPLERTAAYSVQLSGRGGKKKAYTGRRIDLDFKDADIHNILRLLSDVGQVNIVTADDVGGTVTIRMRDVPWDHALDVILQAKRLGMVRQGNLIRVAPMATLEKELEMELARRRQSEALEPLETRLIPVSYAQADEIKPRAADLLSERGKLSVDARTNVIIARDVAPALDQIEALIRNLDTQTPQVLIEGRIVEASSTYAREIGIQWGGDFSASSATGNPTGLAFPSTVGMAGGATDSQTPTGGLSPIAGGQPNPNFAVNLPAAAGTNSGGALGITLGSISNNANLNLRLSALEEEGTLRILSSPKILTLDNREAHIEQGTLIPYSRISAQGIQTSFKEAKLNLTVTPHVTADGSVLLNLKMTRDEPDFNNTGARGDPTILKREAQTQLLVNDGHTAVIGGIFTRNHGTNYKKVPFFGDIPVLGWLFKKRSDSDRRSEMLIFITPRIVNRAESIGQ